MTMLFVGFFAAMAAGSAIVGIVTRSAVSAVYALLMLVLASIELANVVHAGYGSATVDGVLFAGYLACLTLFALTLLQTMHYERALGNAAIVVMAINLPLAVAGDAATFWRLHFFVLDEIALGALIVLLVTLGVRAFRREGAAIALTYVTALAGPALAALTPWLPWSFATGHVWAALFFAYAVALRNRGAQGERDRFERLAYLDGLTGVANRRTFDETLERMWNVARRAKVPVAVAMIDIDHFKRLNDTRGHQVGDECLRRVAAVCSSVLRRAGDCFARYGGEEFAAILVNVDLDHAKTLAENMRRAVERDGGITVSIGLAARVPRDEDSQHALIADADGALYRAKHEGRNCVRFADVAAQSALN